MPIRLFFLLILFLSCRTAQESDLSKAEALEDINKLQTTLAQYHAGLYRFSSKDSINFYFDLVRSRLDNTSTVDLYKEITFLLNKVRCGHTRASLPSNVRDSFIEASIFLPLKVSYLGDRLFIRQVLEGEQNLVEGEEILSINGQSIVVITAKIFDHHSSDGFINTNKYRLTERFFKYYYQLYIAKSAVQYRLKIRGNNGKDRVITLEGKPLEELRELDYPPFARATLSLEHLDKYSYMKIGTFGSYSLNNAGFDYSQFLEQSFDALKKRKVENLILDLRGNGGGKDDYGALLVSYFAKAPFKYFERIEVTDDYSGYGGVQRKSGRNLVTTHRGLSTWQPQKNSFAGKVFVLIDGWSFSTCADVATVLHHHKWATFVGEETGGGYDGNTSGNSTTLTLPNSKIRVNVPMWMYTTANLGHQYYGRGVIPDYQITRNPQELISETDVVREKAINLMK